jgi:hypothetical protein
MKNDWNKNYPGLFSFCLYIIFPKLKLKLVSLLSIKYSQKNNCTHKSFGKNLVESKKYAWYEGPFLMPMWSTTFSSWPFENMVFIKKKKKIELIEVTQHFRSDRKNLIKIQYLWNYQYSVLIIIVIVSKLNRLDLSDDIKLIKLSFCCTNTQFYVIQWARLFRRFDFFRPMRPMGNTFSKSSCVAHWSHPLYHS